MKVDLYTQTGEKDGQLNLPSEIFEQSFNKDLIHQALVRQLANGRVAIAHAKTKGEISGGGRKPYKQKGTGNARQGSIRAPQMRGGGVVFGPRNERNFEKDMPKKQRRAALFSALSKKASDGQILGLKSYEGELPKTKDLRTLLDKIKIEKSVLIVSGSKNEVLEKSSSNLKNAKYILANYINIQDLQKHRTVILLEDSVEKMKELFLSK